MEEVEFSQFLLLCSHKIINEMKSNDLLRGNDDDDDDDYGDDMLAACE